MKRLNDNEKVMLVDLDQSSGEWLEWRNQGIGSSDVALLMSPEPVFDRTVGTLWKQRMGYERAVELDNEHIQRGKTLEPKIRDLVNKKLGTSFEPMCVLRTDAPYLRASLDGLDLDFDCLLEIKAPSDKVFEKYLSTWQIPENYYLQMQYQMLCSDVEYGYFAFAREVPVDVPWIEEKTELEVYIIPVRNNYGLQLEIEKQCALFMKGIETKTPVGWMDGKLSLYHTAPTMFVIIGGPEAVKTVEKIKDFPIPLIAERGKMVDTARSSFVIMVKDYSAIPHLKMLHPEHSVKIINLTKSPFANTIHEVELTKKGLLAHLSTLV